MLNPWSIVNVCEEKKLSPFWVERGGTSTLQKFLWNSDLKFKDAISQLLRGQSIQVKLLEDVTYKDFGHGDSASLWSLLYYVGYVTMDRDSWLLIPNVEVTKQWEGWFLTCVNQRTSVASLLDLLLAGDVAGLAESFPIVVMECLSYFDVGSSNSAENFLVASRDRGFQITSNREAGTGRYDVMIVPQSQHNIRYSYRVHSRTGARDIRVGGGYRIEAN